MMQTLHALAVALCAALSAVSASADTVLVAHSNLQLHNTQARHGLYSDAALAGKQAGLTTLVPGVKTGLPGKSYAQLLYVASKSGFSRDRLIVVTEENYVLSINAATGAVVWSKALLPAVPASALPCGNITPFQGITSTPVIDPIAGIVYTAAATTKDGGKTIRAMIYALHLSSGAVVSGWPVDVHAALAKQKMTFLPQNQNQRGALTLLNGILYVPYGGLDGDCEVYHGWVIGVQVAKPAQVKAFRTAAASRGGMWTPGGVSSDGVNLFATSGNTQGAPYWQGGNAVFKFSAGPSFSNRTSDYYVPKQWRQYDAADTDLCGSEPVVVDLPGSSHTKLLLQAGKDGKVYILNRSNLGGFGTELYSNKASNSVIIDVPSVYHTSKGTYMAFKTSAPICPPGSPPNPDLMSIRLIPGNPPSWRTAWCAYHQGKGSSIATTADNKTAVVWAVGAEDSNTLFAFDGDTGEQLFQSAPLGPVARFYSPTVARGRIYVASDKLNVFQIGGGASSPTLRDISVNVTAPTPSSADAERRSIACLLAVALLVIGSSTYIV